MKAAGARFGQCLDLFRQPQQRVAPVIGEQFHPGHTRREENPPFAWLLPQLTAVVSDQQSTSRVMKVEVNRPLAQQLGISPSVLDPSSAMRPASESRRGSIQGSTSIS